MKASELKPGDVLFHEHDDFIGEGVVFFTGGRFSHVGQIVHKGGQTLVANMECPTCRYLTIPQWFDEYGPVYCGRMKVPLKPYQEIRLGSWWAGHIGEIYGFLLAPRLALVSWWQRVCLKLGWNKIARIQPRTKLLVCSTAIAEAFRYAWVEVDETTGMTPEDLEDQACLAPVEKVEL